MPFCALIALGCSEAPPVTDAATDGGVARDDGPPAEDRPAATDAGPVVDVPAPADRPDAGAPVDRPAATDVVDAPDLPDVVLAVDVLPDGATEDRPAVDAGPQDAGPVTYPLDPPPSTTEVRVLYARTCASADGGACDAMLSDTAAGAMCSRTGNRLSFFLRACIGPRGGCTDLTGVFPDYRSASGASIAVFDGAATQGRDFVIESGSVAGGRQSFRVSFSAPATSNASGVTGVPGRTLSHERGDIWLLGCEVR